jgi:hypothetical protein
MLKKTQRFPEGFSDRKRNIIMTKKHATRLLAALSITVPAMLPPSVQLPSQRALAQNQSAQKSFAFYFKNDHPLNTQLIDALKDGDPDANYNVLNSQGSGNIEALLAAVAAFYLEHVNEPTTTRSGLTLQFEDQNLSWSEVRQLATADWVLVPDWNWAETSLDKIVLGDVDGVPTWAILAENTLSLTLTPYQFEANQFVAGTPIYRNWNISRKIPIRDTQQLEQVVQKGTGRKVSIAESGDHGAILAVVRQFPTFKGMMGQDPSEYFAEAAAQNITSQRAERILRSLQARSGNTNTPQNNTPNTNNQNNQNNTPNTPRTPGKGIGLGIAIKGGTIPLWINGTSQQYIFDPLNLFVPAAGLDIRYNLGNLTGWDDFYITLGGATNVQLVSQTQQDASQPPPIQGVPVQNPFAAAMGIIGELGLAKRWRFGDYYLEGSLKGGMMGGLLMDSGVINQFTGFPDTPYTFTFGGTVGLGGGWQINDNFALGLETGFRYYADGFWTDSIGNPVAFPFLSAVGPVLQVSVEYMF